MRGRWAALAVVFLARLSMGFQFQSIASVGPFLQADFALSYAQLGWLMGLFLLPGAVIALPGGMLGQRFGDRRVVVIGLGMMAAGGLVTAASPTFVLACAGRALSGAGGVLLNVLLAKMVADWFIGREISTAMGVMLAAWPAGIALATASLGAAASRFGWRAAIDATVAGAVLAALLMLSLYRNPPRPPEPVTSGTPTRLRGREVGLATLAGLGWTAFNASFIVFVSFVPGYLIAGGTSVAEAGLLVSLAVWVTIGSVPLGGWVADRLHDRDRAVALGCLATALAIALVPLAPGLLLWLLLVGLLVGVPPGAIMALLPTALPAARLATGLGLYYSVYYLGMAGAQPLSGWSRDLTASPATPVFVAALLMAATVPALAVFRVVARRQPTAPPA